MTKQETVQIITLLAGNYSKIAEKTNEQKQIMLNTWYECLNDLDYNIVLKAVKKSIIESNYIPTISEIRKNAIELINPTENNVLQSWEECYRMICNGNYMTQEEFDKHSEVCKLFLGSTAQLRDYARSDIDVINTVVKGQFIKQYDVLIKRQKEDKLLPEDMKEIINKLTDKFEIKMLGDE